MTPQRNYTCATKNQIEPTGSDPPVINPLAMHIEGNNEPVDLKRLDRAETARVERKGAEDAAKNISAGNDASNEAVNDASLVRRAVAGDEKAFGQLVDRHSQRLYRLAYSLVGSGSDAEDVLQETWVGAYRGLSGFEGRSSFGTWLTRILVAQAARWRRDRKRRSRGSEPDENQVGVRSASEAVGSKIDLHAALQKLSPEHREIVVLREFEQMSYEEMAAVLSLPRGTVESRLFRARGELRELLKAYLP
jgi:RNA polymerase sigma-70 factor (ECF subfamily)